MVEISKDIFDNLKCCECTQYLSCSPVFLNNNGDSVCGRCSVPNYFKMGRNKSYEQLASAVLFPCMYDKYGCLEKFTLNNMEQHEKECRFHKYDCLMLPTRSCSWTGNGSELLKHYTEKHPECLLENPAKLQPNITENNDRNLLMSAFGFLFLIQFRCRVNFDTFWVNVRLLESSSLTHLFDYKVEISNGADKVIRMKNVQNQRRLPNILTKESIEFSLKSILNDTRDNNERWFTISIEMKESQCGVCKKVLKCAPIFSKNDVLYCESCFSGLSTLCKYSVEGCTYQNNQLNLGKHEKWLCKHARARCTKCRIILKEVSLLEHDMDKHSIFKVTSDKLSFKSLYDGQKYTALFKTQNAMFYCIWKVSLDSLDFNIISNLDKTENRKFSFNLRLTHPNYEYSIFHELSIIEQNSYFDWDLTRKGVEFMNIYDENNTYHLCLSMSGPKL